MDHLNNNVFLFFSSTLCIIFDASFHFFLCFLKLSGWLASYSESVGGACINNYSFFSSMYFLFFGKYMKFIFFSRL